MSPPDSSSFRARASRGDRTRKQKHFRRLCTDTTVNIFLTSNFVHFCKRCAVVITVLHCPFREIRVALPRTSRKSSATQSYRCVQYFRVFKQWIGCQCLGFLMCIQTTIHAIAHGCCTDTVKESALEVYPGIKIRCRTGARTRVSISPGFSVGRKLYQLSYPALYRGFFFLFFYHFIVPCGKI